jgi:hypothetical protein
MCRKTSRRFNGNKSTMLHYYLSNYLAVPSSQPAIRIAATPQTTIGLNAGESIIPGSINAYVVATVTGI